MQHLIVVVNFFCYLLIWAYELISCVAKLKTCADIKEELSKLDYDHNNHSLF